jgi:hypothetical protein
VLVCSERMVVGDWFSQREKYSVFFDAIRVQRSQRRCSVKTTIFLRGGGRGGFCGHRGPKVHR